jgi:hypothetical protein
LSLAHRYRPTLDTHCKSFPLHQFKNQKARTAGFSLTVNGGDVGVIEACQNLGFTLKAAGTFRISGELVGKDLDCNVPLQFGIASAKTSPMPPLPNNAVIS